MIVTARCARFLRSLPDDDATRILDAVATAAADPLANPVHCKRLAPGLYEARITLHHRCAYRVMFGFRAGVPVLLSACLKKSASGYQHAIDEARQVIAADGPLQGVAMPHNLPTNTPFDVRVSWLYDARGRQLKIVHMTRQKVVIDTDTGRVTLSRARLEQDGYDIAAGATYRMTRYRVPHKMEMSA